MVQLSGVGPGDWVTLNARRAPSSACLVHPDGRVVTFEQAHDRLARTASALEREGVVRGDVVALMATDSPEYVLTVLACMRIGAVVAPLNYRLQQSEIEALTDLASPACAIIGSRYASHVPAVRRAGARLVLGLGGAVAGADADLDDLVATGSPDEAPAATHDDDVLCMMLTSGTTGRPKGVLQSQRMIKANTVKGVVEHAFTSDDRLYPGPPLFHVAGLGYVFYGLSRGASAVVLPQFDADEVLRVLSENGVTRALLVPSMLSALLTHPQLPDDGFPDLRAIAYGGSPMSPAMLRRVVAVFGCDLYNTFGSATEGGGQTVLRPEDHRRALAGEAHLLGSIGRAQYGVDLKLCDPDGSPVRDGEIGEIWTRGDATMSGYAGSETLTADRVVDGWFRGGDLARRDAEGYLFLAGRVDDMIIRGGENIYPVEVESVLSEVGGVREVSVLGLADEHWGQVVAAVVRLEGEPPDDDSLLRRTCREHLAGYKVPERVFVTDAFPLNATGKPDLRELRAWIEDGRLRELTSSGVRR